MRSQIPQLIRRLLTGGTSDEHAATLARGTVAAFMLNTAGVLAAFLLQVLLARTMLVKGYGTYSYVVSWASLFLLAATFGFDLALLRFVPIYVAEKNWPRLRGVLKSSTLIAISGGIVVGLLLAAVCYFRRENLGNELYQTFLWSVPLLPLMALLNLRGGALRALKHVAYARFPEAVLRPLIFMTLLGSAWFVGVAPIPAPAAMAFLVIATAAALGLSSFNLWRVFPEQAADAEHEYEHRLWLATGASLLLVSGMYVILNEIDKVMIGLLGDVESVGIYSVATRISSLILFGLQSVNTIAAPMISEIYAKGSKAELQLFVARVSGWVALVSLPLFAGALMLGYPVLKLFGAEYVSGYWALVFLALGQFINMGVGPVGFLLSMTGHQNIQLRILLISIATNVVLNVPGIRYFGIEGVALATGFSIGLRNFLCWRAAKQHLGVDASVLYLLRRYLALKGGEK